MNVNFSKSAASLALSMIALSAPAFAVGADYDYPKDTVVVSNKTRAEVMTEFVEARAQGLLSARDHEYPVVKAPSGNRSRAEVAAEAIEAARNEKLPSSLYFGG